MQLQIKDGKVIAFYKDDVVVPACEGCEVVKIDRDIEITGVPFDDPRTEEEKSKVYKDQRRAEYPSIAEQLDMIYWDHVNGTTTWQDSIAAIKTKYPKT